MADKEKFDPPTISKLTKLLLVVLSPSTLDGEWTNALEALQRILKEVDPGGHELVARLGTASISDEEMQRVFDEGRKVGRSEEAEQRRKSMVAVTASYAGGGDAKGFNGYSWREIVGFCLLNNHRIYNDWEVNFIASAAPAIVQPLLRTVGEADTDRAANFSKLVQRKNNLGAYP